MKIGSYEVVTIETGEFALDGGAMFGVVPKPLWSKKIGVDEKNRIDMRLRCLLLKGDGRNILVDNGMGTKWNEKLTDIYRLDHSQYNLEKALAEYNLTCDQITDVWLTHLHFDHAGGSTQEENGRPVPTFPNATYYVQKDHLEWARNPKEKDRGSFMANDWEPLAKAGVLKVVEGEKEILPGCRAKLFHGHTRASQGLFLDDGQTKLLFCADTIPTSLHLSLPWIMSYDNFPLITLEEKKKVLDQASKEKWILVFEHCPHVAASRIEKTEKGFQILEKIGL